MVGAEAVAGRERGDARGRAERPYAHRATERGSRHEGAQGARRGLAVSRWKVRWVLLGRPKPQCLSPADGGSPAGRSRGLLLQRADSSDYLWFERRWETVGGKAWRACDSVGQTIQKATCNYGTLNAAAG